MAILLDTHTFLWFVSGDKQLPEKLKSKILDINEPCYISIASLWEITIKIQIGIIAILLPMLIARFSPEEADEKALAEN